MEGVALPPQKKKINKIITSVTHSAALHHVCSIFIVYLSNCALNSNASELVTFILIINT